MASLNNVPKDILESMRDVVDRRVKLSIKRLVNYETKREKVEHRVLAFSSHRLFIFSAKVPSKVEASFHYLDIDSIDSKRPNHLVITASGKPYTFTTIEADYADEVNHMITHIGTSLKTIFPVYPLERILKKIDVQPTERLKVMYDLMKDIEEKETGPCGGFTLMYVCMCDYHGLTYRDEVAWDVDTIYLSQDSKELCLKDFDHLKERDLVPIVAALTHNNWFTSLNANNIKLSGDVCNEILRVMLKNSVIESLHLSNTAISSDFVKRLSTTSTHLQRLDLSWNPGVEDIGIEHLIGTFSSRGKACTWLDLSNTKITTKGLNKIAESMNRSPHVFSCLQSLKLASLQPSKMDDLQSLYTFLASPNMISHLDLSATEVEIDKLMSPLLRGCSQNIVELKLSKVVYSKKNKDVAVQSTFKQFFSSVLALKYVDFSYTKLPPDAIKDLFLGISANRNLQDVHVNLSNAEVSPPAFANLHNCLIGVKNVARLDLSCMVKGPSTGLTDIELIQLLDSIGENNTIKHVALGQLFYSVKPKSIKAVMEKLVDVLQAEDSVIESLSLADSKLKDNLNMIINALGSNMSLTELDISGNFLGDLGARMLSKALQINNKLKTIFWDKNNTTYQGFQDVADALQKNYTLRKMPVPVYDASAALRSEPQKTEQALQTIEWLLQRNHSPQKYSSGQAYRLQQGFLISSTQQMVDRLVVQSQDTINALSLDSLQPYTNDIEATKTYIKDADKTKTLLPRLHDIATQSQTPSSAVSKTLKEISEDLKHVLAKQMKTTVEEMIETATNQCTGIMNDEEFKKELRTGCSDKSSFPKDFTANVLNGVDTDIFNKLSELNLAVAAHVSDRIVDEVIIRLSQCHKTLTNHLNEKKKGRSPSNAGQDSPQESPKMLQRKSILSRRVRPQSVIDILDGEAEVSVKPVKKPASSSEELDTVPDLPTETRLQNVTKDRVRARRNVRPTTRQSALPKSKSENSLKVDEGIETFFSSSGTHTSTPNINGPRADDSSTSSKNSSAKSTPENKKKGLFGFGGSRDKEPKDGKKASPVLGGLFSKKSPKPSPTSSSKKPSRVSDVLEEDHAEDKTTNNSNVKHASSKDESSLRSSDRRPSDKPDGDTVSQVSTGLDRKSSKSSSGSSPMASPGPQLRSGKSLDNDQTKDTKDEAKVKVESDHDSEPEDNVTKEKDGEVEKRGSVDETRSGDRKSSDNDKGNSEDSRKSSEGGASLKSEDSGDEVEDNTHRKASEDDNTDNKDDDSANKKGTEEEKPEAEPEPVKPRRPPGPTGIGMGFGMDIMQQLRQKQENRVSKSPKLSDIERKSEEKPQDKPSPFALPKLRSVPKKEESAKGDKSVGEKQTTMPKPDTDRQSSDSGKGEEKGPELLKRPSLKDSDKPSVSPRPSRPLPPMKPKPGVPGNKPTPVPRRSTASDGGETEDANADSSKLEKSNTSNSSSKVESGVVYDSATLKKSVKDKISMFHAVDSTDSVARSNSIKDEKQGAPPPIAPKSSSLPRDTKPTTTLKSASLPKDASPTDIQQAGDLEGHQGEDNNNMTDSGIVTDTDTTPKSDLFSKLNSTQLRSSDKVRPKSMFAGFEGRAHLRSRHEPATGLDKPTEKDEMDGNADVNTDKDEKRKSDEPIIV